MGRTGCCDAGSQEARVGREDHGEREAGCGINGHTLHATAGSLPLRGTTWGAGDFWGKGYSREEGYGGDGPLVMIWIWRYGSRACIGRYTFHLSYRLSMSFTGSVTLLLRIAVCSFLRVIIWFCIGFVAALSCTCVGLLGYVLLGRIH